MSRTPWRVTVATAVFAVGMGWAFGASVQQADVTATLGPSFLLDQAARGGSDHTVNEPGTANFDRDLGPLSVGASGSRVTITGVGWATSSSVTANDADTATVTVTYLGADGVFGGGDDVVLGSEAASWAHAGAGEYAWAFDTVMEAVVDGAGTMFRIAVKPGNAGGTGSLRFKSTGGAGGVKVSVAGTSVAEGGGGGGSAILTSGYVIGSGDLSPNSEVMFSDRAATGASDGPTFADGAVTFALQYTGIWNLGADVTLTGMAVPLRTPTSMGTVSFAFYDVGSDDVFSGTGSETLVGTATGTLEADLSAAGAYYVNFETPVSYMSTGTGVVVHITSNASIRFKVANATQAGAGTGAQAVRVNAASGAAIGGASPLMKTSLAGTATGGTPVLVNTASAGGFWDTLSWNTSAGGTASGDLPDGDTVVVGSERRVEYRGSPANETVAALRLGGEAGSGGHGYLDVSAGSLSVTGDLVVGRGTGENDGFLTVEGGALAVGGDAEFGTTVSGADGSLIVAGGTVTVAGDLRLGDWNTSGSMLRFHNPGSSPAVGVGGELRLGRCSLDLTYDSSYTHDPGGSDITLVEYESRDAQFLNFRRGDEFNCGPNRFRINYDVPSSGKLAITLTPLANYSRPAGQPNIVFLFVDDQGYKDLDLYTDGEHPGLGGDPKFPTPNIRTLADEGAKFTSGYVVGSVCHISRVAILSGQYPQRMGTDSNLGGPNYNGLAVSRRSIPRKLQSAGYRTYGIGKWHLGDTVEFHPNLRGFDRWYGMTGGSRSYDGDQGGPESAENRVFHDDFIPRPQDEGLYLTDRIGDAAVDFIDEHQASDRAADPFYMYVSFTAVHAPMHAEDSRLNALATTYGLTASDYSEPNYRELAAMTLALDDNVRKIREKLADPLGDGTGPGNDSDNLLANTLIVYMNDNGGPEKENGGSSGDNWSNNGLLRANKGDLYEGGVRVPTFLSWPAGVSGGQVTNDPVTSLDIQATFLSAAGVANREKAGLDGLDLLPRVADGLPMPDERVICWRRRGSDQSRSAIRKGNWKMVIVDNVEPEAYQLFNLATDLDESSNVAASNPEVVADLLGDYAAWEARTLTPFYNGTSLEFDAGLERRAAETGYRILNRDADLRWLDTIFRYPLDMSAGFAVGVFLRPTEAVHGAGDALWFGLGDSRNPAELIRAGVDFETGALTLVEGKTGLSDSAVLAGGDVPADYEMLRLDYDGGSGVLTASLGASSVAITPGGSYAGNALGYHAYGAASMEGEFSPPVLDPGAAVVPLDAFRFEDGTGVVTLEATVPGSGVFYPVLERSTDLEDFTTDPGSLIEYVGGGRYRASTAIAPQEEREFFRMSFGQP